MSARGFEEHLGAPGFRRAVPAGALVGSAGGALCGDLVRIAVVCEGNAIVEVSFDADGCGAAIAAGSAAATLVAGRTALEAARVGAVEIATELGGLSAGKMHAADLAADALHRALAKHWSRLVEVGAVGEQLLDRRLIAMSGGVDSATAAVLTQRAGTDTVAVTLKLWQDERNDEQGSCCSPAAVVRARALAHSLNMPHMTLDLRDRFRSEVVDDYIDEHARGRTPNPCVRCNGMLRFDGMLALADAVGATHLVTGHYARIEHDGEGPLLAAAVDPFKDQAYMLAALAPDLLDRIEFPLAEIEKPRTREIAAAAGLPVASRPDSQDLCFLAGTDRTEFLARHGAIADEPGDVLDVNGRRLGTHRGHFNYTVGQRRGLGIAADQPLYVVAVNADANTVTVGPRRLLARRVVELTAAQLYRDSVRVTAVKLRYRSGPLPCRVEPSLAAGCHDRLDLWLGRDAYGVAAGQVACLYDDAGRVVGHGVIAAGRPVDARRDAAAAVPA